MKIGLIGCGQVALGVHLPNLRRLGVKVGGLCDPSPEALQAAGQLAPEAPRWNSLEAMLKCPGVEAVLISSPPAYHARQALACLQAGLPVYLEKPLATSLEDGQALVEAARQSRPLVALGFNLRFHPLFQEMRRLFRSGRIGKLISMRSVFSSGGLLTDSWRRGQGGGALLELGSHHFDLVHFLSGQEIATIHNQTAQHGLQAWSTARLEQGAGYQGFFSLDCADDERFEIYGEQGRLSLQRYASAEVEVHPRSGQRLRWRRLLALLRSPLHLGYVLNKFRSPCHEPSYYPCMQSFLEACRSQCNWSGATPADGLRALRWALASID